MYFIAVFILCSPAYYINHTTRTNFPPSDSGVVDGRRSTRAMMMKTGRKKALQTSIMTNFNISYWRDINTRRWCGCWLFLETKLSRPLPCVLCCLLRRDLGKQKTAHVYRQRRRQRLQKALPGHNFPDIDGSAQRGKDEDEEGEKKKRSEMVFYVSRHRATAVEECAQI